MSYFQNPKIFKFHQNLDRRHSTLCIFIFVPLQINYKCISFSGVNHSMLPILDKNKTQNTKTIGSSLRQLKLDINSRKFKFNKILKVVH